MVGSAEFVFFTTDLHGLVGIVLPWRSGESGDSGRAGVLDRLNRIYEIVVWLGRAPSRPYVLTQRHRGTKAQRS